MKILRIFAVMEQSMEQLAKFVLEHIGDDTSRLLLARSKRPDIDMDLAVNCIESRRKLKGKVQEWYDEPSLVFPARLSAEQCSSSAAGRYKADLAERISSYSRGFHEGGKQEDRDGQTWKIADLTGGLGVDSWFFSKRASEVLYNEMQAALCEAARHNFKSLGAENIMISNNAVGGGPSEITPTELLAEFRPDIVYLDPARRGEGGKKVFLIEECTPDVLTLKDELFRLTRHILMKLSPMADITMVCGRLGESCREVHAVAAGGECKELLIWMDREWKGEYSVHAVELPPGYPASEPSLFSFLPSEERRCGEQCADGVGTCLFEPGKALMKSGAFNLVGQRFGIRKLGRSTHYYFFDDNDRISDLKGLGKVYEILRCGPLDKRTIKAAGKDYPKAEVTARNIPMDTDALRKRLGVTSGDDAHIFGLKSDICGNLLLCAKRVF